jgi:Terpene synthase family 2, C-terminal metal binding
MESSADRVQSWELSYGLVGSEDGISRYHLWNLKDFVGCAYPHAEPGAGIDLVGKFITAAIQLDDFIDHAVSAAECLETIEPLLQIVRADGAYTDYSALPPIYNAFADVIRESVRLGTYEWWNRARENWINALTAIVHETANREFRGKPAPYDIFLEIRRQSGYMEPFLDIIEPASGLMVPNVARCSPQLSIMRRIVADLGNFINDVYSVEKEIESGQYDNLVFVLQSEGGLTIDAAIQSAFSIIERRAERFLEIRSELPAVYKTLSFTPAATESVQVYADALEMWVSGFVSWQTRSPRYQTEQRSEQQCSNLDRQ